MKLADLRAEGYNNSISEEDLNKLRLSKNAKEVYNLLNFQFDSKYSGSYSLNSDSILKAVAKYSNGFVVNIAERFSSPSNKYPMSERQLWCISYAFLEIEQILCYNNL